MTDRRVLLRGWITLSAVWFICIVLYSWYELNTSAAMIAKFCETISCAEGSTPKWNLPDFFAGQFGILWLVPCLMALVCGLGILWTMKSLRSDVRQAFIRGWATASAVGFGGVVIYVWYTLRTLHVTRLLDCITKHRECEPLNTPLYLAYQFGMLWLGPSVLVLIAGMGAIWMMDAAKRPSAPG